MERRPWHPVSLLVALLLGLTIRGAARAEEAKQPEASDFELYQIFADTLDQIERNYVKDVSRRELMEAAIDGVLEKLDPYSNYISPDDIGRFKSNVEHQFGGIGIQIGIENGQLKVISPLLGTPAYRARLESGDAILEIDGKSTEGIQIDQAVKQLKGEAGSKVTLTIRHAGSRAKENVTITREVVHVDTVLGDSRKKDDSWDFMLDHDKHIGYIRITAFSRGTAAEMRKALEELQAEGLKGLIVDLRFNPGGLLSSAIEVTDLFLPKGRIVSTQGRNTPERSWDAHEDGTFVGFPMVVLVNHYSASASEIFSAALQDHNRAVVIGERTWGKGSVQNVIELEGGRSALKLTTAGYHRPSGKNIHRFPNASEDDEWGVMPNDGYEVELNGSQTAQLIEYRRKRDILVGKHQRALAAKEESESDDEDEAKPAESGDEKPEAEAAKETGSDAAGESESDDSAADEKTPGDEEPAEKEPVLEEESSDRDEGERPEFVDLQLQKAVDYLTTELAKAE
ncbi:MAG: PDZ domain-containing protein [Planctomycetota bacterium]|nr:MAG: PDZ domain-containing protein [Planctomycetota bacterium]